MAGLGYMAISEPATVPRGQGYSKWLSPVTFTLRKRKEEPVSSIQKDWR